jgi:hypothetical protein
VSKRTPGLARIANDAYYTPPEAIAPLLPHLSPSTRFIEPCAGNGRLARYLSQHGHHCVWSCDIAPEREGIERMNALNIGPERIKTLGADCFITNPSWRRPLLHALIQHLPTMLPTWLLFDSDWLFTNMAAQHGQHCAKIVSIGRVKWIEDSDSVGFDNAMWALFDRGHRGPPRFYFKRDQKGWKP